MEREVATARGVNMLCMGMVLAVATLLFEIGDWIVAGVNIDSIRVDVLHPVAMFAVGVGVRFLGSIITRNATRVLHVMVGDVAAVFIGLLAFFLVAAAHDQANIVTLAAIILTIIALPTAAITSLIASSVARSRSAVAVMGSVSLCILLCAVAVQGIVYWA